MTPEEMERAVLKGNMRAWHRQQWMTNPFLVSIWLLGIPFAVLMVCSMLGITWEGLKAFVWSGSGMMLLAVLGGVCIPLYVMGYWPWRYKD